MPPRPAGSVGCARTWQTSQASASTLDGFSVSHRERLLERAAGPRAPAESSGPTARAHSGPKAVAPATPQGGLEPCRRGPRSSTISRSCSDHRGLRQPRVPVRPSRSLACPRGVAATWQQLRAPAGLKTAFSFRPTTGGRLLAMCSGDRTRAGDVRGPDEALLAAFANGDAGAFGDADAATARVAGGVGTEPPAPPALPAVDVEGAAQRRSSRWSGRPGFTSTARRLPFRSCASRCCGSVGRCSATGRAA
jgi:hypothetical protein